MISTQQSHRDACEFGRELLGPVVAYYLCQLDAYVRYFLEERNAAVLFVAKAGIRMLDLYRRFLKSVNRGMPSGLDHFWISRCLLTKGLWDRVEEETSAVLLEEFKDKHIGDVVEALFCREDDVGSALEPEVARAPASQFLEFLGDGSAGALAVRTALRRQSELFERYFHSRVGERSTVVLVDSGWQSTAQRLLDKAFADKEFHGLYFGNAGSADSDPSVCPFTTGVVFEADSYVRGRPETCFTVHPCLVETLFRAQGPIVEHLAEDSRGVVAPAASDPLSEEPLDANDSIFAGVCDHLEHLTEDDGPARLLGEFQRVIPRVARMVLFPTKEEAAALSAGSRPADFGRSHEVPVLLPPEDRFENDSFELRVACSLWRPGQLALEFPPETAVSLQREVSGLDVEPEQLLRAAHAVPGPSSSRPGSSVPSVAVIVRTKDRPLFLERALASVAGQTFDDLTCVVVNDGGSSEMVCRVVESSTLDKRKVTLVDNVRNLGMEASSNNGIRHSDSEFIVIHDDDDSWEPQFLEETVAFLKSEEGSNYGGVLTHAYHVSEEITPDGIKERKRWGFNDWVENVHLMEMACSNFIPTIAFLFRRTVYDALGGYDENLPVLGDWDFNLRFLAREDIALIRKRLALYHHRDVGNLRAFGNTVVSQGSKHAAYNAVVRNKLIRTAEFGPQFTIAMGLGFMFSDLRHATRGAPAPPRRKRGDSSQPPSPMPGPPEARFQPEQLMDTVRFMSNGVRESASVLTELADERWVMLSILLALVQEKHGLKDVNDAVEELLGVLERTP